MRWLSGAVLVGAAGMGGWGWWLGQRDGLSFVLDADPDSGRRTVLTPDGVVPFTYPVIAFTVTLLVAGAFRWRRDDIRIGMGAWRQRPVALSLGALGWASLPSDCVLLTLLLLDAAAGVPAGRTLTRWLLADRPLAWFVGSLVAMLTVYLLVAGPWLTDHFSRARRYWRRLTLLRAQGDQDQLSRAILELSEEFAERPYREGVLISMLLRINADGPQGELLDSVLRTLARITRLSAPGLMFRVSPLWVEQVKMRLLFAEALMTEYNRTQAGPHLDTALLVLEGLHHRPPFLAGREARAAVALTLAWALGLRHTRDPVAGADDLDRALALAGQAAPLLPREAAGGVLGRLLVKQYERQGDGDALDRAVEALRPAGPSAALIRALVLRHELTGRGDDLSEARSTAEDLAEGGLDAEEGLAMLLYTAVQVPDWTAGPERGLVVNVLERVDALPDVSYPLNMMAAMLKAQLAVEEDPRAALRWYEVALAATQQYASVGLSLDDRRVVLGSQAVPPPVFAGIALSLGHVAWAVELLETGRTVIWSQTRGLRRAAAPSGAADRWQALRRELDRPGYPVSRRDDLLSGHHAAGVRAERAAQWEKLGAGQSLVTRRDFDDLRVAARCGPVVVVNVSDIGCSAVVVTADRDPVHLPLPGADPAQLTVWAGGLLLPGRRGMAARMLGRHLWDTIAVPVLDVVEPYLGPDRRIWWCPTGPLSAVPMHLAGYHDQKNGPALIDHVVSSYTPSLWALRESRGDAPVPAPLSPPPAMLVASLRRTPGTHPELVHAQEEAAMVAARFPAATALGEEKATVAAMRRALHTHPWVHIACHGDEHGLKLYDGSLGLDELADMNLTGDRMAFLSACVTALPDARARDEVLHPAAAFHLNGFSHVIGTMWQIDSADGPTVADDFYRLLLTEGCEPALALHHAQRRLRDQDRSNPVRWAPFSHIGP
ncbi:CHAT domain-containing protein [Streptomyces sp. NPDC101219]|uniref:CHAT domain-containing protein n=1 Tax=Streptomyces sp. NPDC101219 TaxID=3366131 RepID=UPI00381B181A